MIFYACIVKIASIFNESSYVGHNLVVYYTSMICHKHDCDI